MSISAFIKRYPVLTYFALTFLISWGLILLLIAFNGMPATTAEANAQLPVAILAMLGGPSISGLLLTGLVNGRPGYRELWARLLKWRVGVKWYAIALLTAPAVMLPVQYVMTLFSPVYQFGFLGPNGSSMVFLGVMSGILVGICEELGWFGFAIPKLRLRYNVLLTGLMVGVLWGAWHIMANDIWAIRTYSGDLNPTLYAVIAGISYLIGQLPPFRILMVWIYEQTGSLLVMMVMHFSLTACNISFASQTASGVQVLIYIFAQAAAMWGIAAAVVAANRVELSRQPRNN
ncbi:MAG: CPBP family intramembrane metalloprotease [Candidatus Margulisbacteria bacterium]|nr:CPBP family intramembrane metalloprotease [Candidatus Margulisiibacteriota bacterium]